MLTIPKFDLSREKTWALRLGLMFFILLSLLLLARALVPYFPQPLPLPRPKSAVELRLEQQGIVLPSTEEILKRQGVAVKDRKPNTLETIYYLAGAIIVLTGTVRPIARELRRRRQRADVDYDRDEFETAD